MSPGRFRAARKRTRSAMDVPLARMLSTSYRPSGLLVLPLLPLVMVPEVEHVEQVPDRGDVGRYVGRARAHDRIGQVVTAAVGEWLQVPVALNELHYRGMIVVAVHHLAAFGPVRDDQHRDTRTITEEVERYERPRIPEATSLVEGDDQRRVLILIHIQPVN